MEKDLYVGSLSRYYTQNWFEDLKPADSDLTPAEIQKITSGWRDSVMQAIQSTVGKREGWEERLDGPFRLAKLEEPAVDALLLYAAAKMYNEPYPGRLPLDWNPDDEPLIQRAKADEQANWSLFRNAEWWLPVEQPLLFQGETPTGDMITLSTAGALMLELLRLNELGWKADEAAVLSWSERKVDRNEEGYSTVSLARNAYANLWQSAKFALQNNLPIVLERDTDEETE